MRLGDLSQHAEGEDGAEPNVTPLIDIVFILLIFFLVTTTFAKDLGLDIDRPAAATGSEQPADVLRVAVGRDGSLTVAARPTSPWNLSAAVRRALVSRRDKSVLLVSDEGVEAGALVDVMDACRLAGASRVAVAVEGRANDGAAAAGSPAP
ncbi:MAG: biopolymer transporter ExbD [Myxococcota bacterium]